MKRKCNENCLCLKCMKSCGKGCEGCNKLLHDIKFKVASCKDYCAEYKQMTIDDMLKG